MPTPYEIAQGFVGQREGRSNAMLNDFLNNGGQNLTSDQFAWCARFVRQAAAKAGVDASGATDGARSFLNVGSPVSDPVEGDVAVFSRGAPGSGLGHVGFYAGQGSTPGTVRILAGNQGDSVAYADYPSSRLLGFRRLGQPGDGGAQMASAPQSPASGQIQGNGAVFGRLSIPDARIAAAEPEKPAQRTPEDVPELDLSIAYPKPAGVDPRRLRTIVASRSKLRQGSLA